MNEGHFCYELSNCHSEYIGLKSICFKIPYKIHNLMIKMIVDKTHLQVIKPQFSIAPAEKSGRATVSILGKGNLILK